MWYWLMKLDCMIWSLNLPKSITQKRLSFQYSLYISSSNDLNKPSMMAAPTNLPCYLVNNLTYSAEQCKFIIDNDCLEEESLIDYVYLVYCELGSELRLLSIFLIILLVIVLFLALSSVADEFLCPSTLTVAKSLRMSDSLAVSSTR